MATHSSTAPAARETLSSHAARPHVVILGGGVAGLTAAAELQRQLGSRLQLTLISANDRFVLGLTLPQLAVGRRPHAIGFPLARALARRHIHFVHAYVQHVSVERRLVLAGAQEIPYDYLIIATGPRADSRAIPGVYGPLNAVHSIGDEQRALEAGAALQSYLQQPGPAVIGAARGAAYIHAAYEFALLLDHALRRRGARTQASLTFVTPEPFLGHLDVGAPAARRVMERLFARRQIAAITAATITRVDREGVHLADGRVVPATYTMILPPVSGAVSIAQSPALTDEQGFIPVDTHYRHIRYPEIYAVGEAAHTTITSPVAAGRPQTGYLAAAMARTAAHNVAAAILGERPDPQPLPRLMDIRLIDGGRSGLLLLTMERERQAQWALPLPGRTASWLKRTLTRYLLYKLRTGHTRWP
jgi:sulfide:quinone oxidoreductase